MDRTGRKKKEFASHDFYFIKSVPEIIDIIQTLQNSAQRQD